MCYAGLSVRMRNSSTQKAYQYIRERILNREFPPGSFLSALNLSKQIGVSRPTVKEALRHLEQEELVRIEAKVGAFVQTLTLEEFQELVGFRTALEAYAAGRAAMFRQDYHLVMLQSLISEMERQVEILKTSPDDIEALNALTAYDVKFHETIIDIARNDLLKRRYTQSRVLHTITPGHVGKWRNDHSKQAEWMADGIVLHRNIFEAIKKSDRRAAQAAMEEHLEQVATRAAFFWNNEER